MSGIAKATLPDVSATMTADRGLRNGGRRLSGPDRLPSIMLARCKDRVDHTLVGTGIFQSENLAVAPCCAIGKSLDLRLVVIEAAKPENPLPVMAGRIQRNLAVAINPGVERRMDLDPA